MAFHTVLIVLSQCFEEHESRKDGRKSHCFKIYGIWTVFWEDVSCFSRLEGKQSWKGNREKTKDEGNKKINKYLQMQSRMIDWEHPERDRFWQKGAHDWKGNWKMQKTLLIKTKLIILAYAISNSLLDAVWTNILLYNCSLKWKLLSHSSRQCSTINGNYLYWYLTY